MLYQNKNSLLFGNIVVFFHLDYSVCKQVFELCKSESEHSR